jgi:hypothetical protein
MIYLIEEVLSKKGIGYRCFNLNKFTINPAGAVIICGIMSAATRAGTGWTICPFSMR